MLEVRLGGPADFEGWRANARRLLAAGIAPEQVTWVADGETTSLFGRGEDPAGAAPARPSRRITVPQQFMELACKAALHRDPERFPLLYRLLWRLDVERRLLRLASDPDVARANTLAKAVDRDIHKMHAFVRFRSVAADDAEHFVAWYEPDHHVVEAAAPFFMRRFAAMIWAILTPERSAYWDGDALRFGPGTPSHAAPAGDALEVMWRSYYRSVFNPARVNPRAMRAGMPKRFWKNLPEATLIKPLIGEAPGRVRAMVESRPAPPVRRRGSEVPGITAAGPSAPPVATLDGLRRAAAACQSCPLWQHATQTVFGEGLPAARVMIVGEQPGDNEDIEGRPFVGPAGRLLDRALAEAGLDRTQLYVTNAVKHFKFEPRGKRRLHKRPQSAEIRACYPWLERELAVLAPDLVVLMGATAMQAVLGRIAAVSEMRGRLVPLAGGRTGLVTVHPSYLLRLPDEAARAAAYRAFVSDLRLVEQTLSRAASP